MPKTLIKRGVALAVAAVLAGCAVGPNYKRPETPAAPQFTGAEASTYSTDQQVVAQFWTQFNDETLNQLVSDALQANHDLRIALGHLVEARAARRESMFDLAPTVTAQGGHTNELVPKVQAGFPFSASYYDAGFDATWELDLFGRVRRSVEAAHAQTEEAVESRNDALVSLEAEVAQTYMRLRGAQALRQITQGLVDQQRDIVALTQDQAKVGLASQLDVKSAAAQYAQTQAQLPQYDQQTQQALNALAYLLGEPPGSLADELSTPAALPPVPPSVPVGLPSTLARRRPDIRRAEQSLHAATAGVGVAVAQFYPDISLTGQAGTRATNASGLTHWSSLFYSFGPSISLPIFEGGSLVANLHLSQAQQQQAALDYRKTVLTALRDVDNALVVYRTDQARQASLGDSVAAQQAAFELARDSYRKGLVTFINLLDAERQLSDAQQQYAQETMQVSTDLVALYKALGGGWQPGENATGATDAVPAKTPGG